MCVKRVSTFREGYHIGRSADVCVEYQPGVQSGVGLPKVKVGSPGPNRNNSDSPL